ncbi:O-pyrocatechuate decarboxylase OS=Tsukamurella paurometabola (strain ATCC 8368 / DSM / CCUG 35730 / CIP 100753 / JCM 10117 / KCTC 9821 / NBRC 16120 / NCIMB 702349 / NCTC 13040) OX=521096 GN=Tpau_1503 PE=4 SV=1 [Tsukamurella paurometabola]|uniref:O-pyrocatechuate decarboxylase n=1 Tax=Tsukamurella paurometabola (strain ATCC 8368 / DSM 20162 / CCUG 35730 / CIP 100753 / JCM 10117 / KCTC 9821 / NBRC 16120 / NCIMB 702349 / NCTC 13040) TaxID=521096 RepID=D5UXN5_TSUPD|nr:amidohydrolase family protein [Tsukamurella paurometabola]ADG78127.1 o-pyrocatechuate decarboxylase [Tsukamurella paurometabola DSM 20162]SUP30314.1 Predicted metal-dependent hydrolase of the TIM-barrel fold [Tsukamurella paurometabola]
MKGKIVLEEHISTARNDRTWDSAGESARNGASYMAAVEHRLRETDERLLEMDACGIDYSILSLTSPGIQSITDTAEAIDAARSDNETIQQEFVDRAPTRFGWFAAVPLQSPDAAADELRRAVGAGAVGALINGYTDLPDGTARYLDHPDNHVFWETASALNVPVYLHPREPLLGQRKVYEGYDSLVGSAWGFGHETATHAIRLMLGGIFDEFPGLQVIVGHLGEGLSILLPRLEHRLRKQRNGIGLGTAQLPVGDYFRRNFYVTTSGHFHTKAVLSAVSELGVDRVLFSVDYPYEDMGEATEWFDHALLAESDRLKIGRENAQRLFSLGQ